MSTKFFDSELNILELLWKDGDLTAGQLAATLKERIGWSRNTTYTVINKLIDKGGIERYGNNFSCKALVTREEIQEFEMVELVEKFFDGVNEDFLDAFFNKYPHLMVDAPEATASDWPPNWLGGEVVRLKEKITEIKERWQL